MSSVDRLTSEDVFISAPHIDFAPRVPKEPTVISTERDTTISLQHAFEAWRYSVRDISTDHRQAVYQSLQARSQAMKTANDAVLDPLLETAYYPATRLNRVVEFTKPFVRFENLSSVSTKIKNFFRGGEFTEMRKRIFGVFYSTLAFGNPGFDNERADFGEILSANFLYKRGAGLYSYVEKHSDLKMRSNRAWLTFLDNHREAPEYAAAVKVTMS